MMARLVNHVVSYVALVVLTAAAGGAIGVLYPYWEWADTRDKDSSERERNFERIRDDTGDRIKRRLYIGALIGGFVGVGMLSTYHGRKRRRKAGAGPSSAPVGREEDTRGKPRH
jgi:hypothetical protein